MVSILPTLSHEPQPISLRQVYNEVPCECVAGYTHDLDRFGMIAEEIDFGDEYQSAMEKLWIRGHLRAARASA